MDAATRRQVAASAAVLCVAVAATLLASPRAVLAAIADFEHRPAAFALVLIGLYAIRPLLAWPISPVSALVGFVLGPTLGIPVALVGATLTSLPPFLLARYAGEDGPFGRLTRAGRDVVAVTGETRGVLAARLSPLPADPVSYGAGFAGVSPRAFVLGTLVGEVPWVIVEVLAGASVRRLSTVGLAARLDVIVLSFALAVVLLAGPTYRHVTGRSPA